MAFLGYLVYNQPCSSVERIAASIKVRTPLNRLMLGFNTDKDALRFGIISPGMVATRKVTVQHPEPATVSIMMEGQLRPWAVISPSLFELSVGETQEVVFDVEVPLWTPVGNYTGEAVFCIKEKRS
jgi:hypothetical protein